MVGIEPGSHDHEIYVYIRKIIMEKPSRIFSDHRKFLRSLFAKLTEASNVLDGVKTFQIDKSSSKLATMTIKL